MGNTTVADLGFDLQVSPTKARKTLLDLHVNLPRTKLKSTSMPLHKYWNKVLPITFLIPARIFLVHSLFLLSQIYLLSPPSSFLASCVPLLLEACSCKLEDTPGLAGVYQS